MNFYILFYIKTYSTYMMISKQDIENNIDRWVFEKIDADFKFRPFQKDTIIDIIYNIVNDEEHNQIIEAPTGAGKSLINIISAGVLADYYNMKSYILVSDLFLLEQYEKFIESHKKMGFGAIRGQTGNYMCNMNGNDIRNAECRMAKIPWAKLFSRNSAIKIGYDCACTCEYVHKRKQAIEASVTLMTYQLFMYTRNVIGNSDGSNKNMLGDRHIIFCDECHNIPDVVQNQYSATITLKDIERLEQIYEKLKTTELLLFDDLMNDNPSEQTQGAIYKEFSNKTLFHDKLMEIWTKINLDTNSRADDYNLLTEYTSILYKFTDVVDEYKTYIASKKSSSLPIPEEEVEKYKLCSWLGNYTCFYSDFWTAIDEAGEDYLIKQINISNVDSHVTVVMNCIKEDYMCYKFVLSHQPYNVFLSATVGGHTAFDENVGIKYTSKQSDENEEIEYNGTSCFKRIPSTFNFDRSPIFALNKYKISYKNKMDVFPRIVDLVYKIIEKNCTGIRGLIQTGSYENAKIIYNSAPASIKSRMLIYNDSAEKRKIIKAYKHNNDSILIGPSINEGIDLPDDGCRFIIIVKVPYPSLGNLLVKEKCKLFPLWYASKTSNNIIQGIGRGNRNEDDYCTTYILDGCFQRLFNDTREQYSDEMKERLKFYN